LRLGSSVASGGSSTIRVRVLKKICKKGKTKKGGNGKGAVGFEPTDAPYAFFFPSADFALRPRKTASAIAAMAQRNQ
jgi:hypothetical protein